MSNARFLKGEFLESTRKVDQELERLLTQATPDEASVSKLWADIAGLLSELQGGGAKGGAAGQPPAGHSARSKVPCYLQEATEIATELAEGPEVMAIADEVRQRVDIVEVVSNYIKLRKAGRDFSGLCPFHSERTASFIVSGERQTWRCFGACGTGGDVFSFLMRVERIEFPEALRRLAERAGLALALPCREAAALDRAALHRAHSKVEALAEALELQDFEESRGFFRRNLASLLTKYRGMYVAITSGQVVDSDKDFSALAARVYKKYGYRHFFMPKVVKERVVYIRTPRPRRLDD